MISKYWLFLLLLTNFLIGFIQSLFPSKYGTVTFIKRKRTSFYDNTHIKSTSEQRSFDLFHNFSYIYNQYSTYPTSLLSIDTPQATIKFNDITSIDYIQQRLLHIHNYTSNKLSESKTVIPNKLQTSVIEAYETLKKCFMERDIEVQLLLLAILSQEHILLLGPPGVGKSDLGRKLASFIQSNHSQLTFFERLLTKYTNPEELFGPLSLSSLEQDKYVRNTQGYLPTASIAFLDEIFKANSAILNSLLTILNERKFDNGNKRLDVPLMAVVGASNELPDSEELDALYDRFLFRRQVSPISDSGMRILLKRGNIENQYDDIKPSRTLLTTEMISDIHSHATHIHIPEYISTLIKNLKHDLREQSINISDRRLLKTMKVLRILAVTQGRNEVNILDCMILPYILFTPSSNIYKDRIYIIKMCFKPISDAKILVDKMSYEIGWKFRTYTLNTIYTEWNKYQQQIQYIREEMIYYSYILNLIMKNIDDICHLFDDSSWYLPQSQSVTFYQDIKILYESYIKDIHDILEKLQSCYYNTAYVCRDLGGDIKLLYNITYMSSSSSIVNITTATCTEHGPIMTTTTTTTNSMTSTNMMNTTTTTINIINPIFSNTTTTNMTFSPDEYIQIIIWKSS